MRRIRFLLGMAIVLAILLSVSLASCTKVEVYWDSEDAIISIIAHRYRPSSTSGWATEEFSILDHAAEKSAGYAVVEIDTSCSIKGYATAEGGHLAIASLINQKRGKWFRGFRDAEEQLDFSDIEALFSADTFTLKTHVDNTWTLASEVVFNSSDKVSLFAMRIYQKFKTHGTEDESDDDLEEQYYAMLLANITGSLSSVAGSSWFPDARHDVWWGNETLYFDLKGSDLEAIIDTDFPIINLWVEPDEIAGEVTRPR